MCKFKVDCRKKDFLSYSEFNFSTFLSANNFYQDRGVRREALARARVFFQSQRKVTGLGNTNFPTAALVKRCTRMLAEIKHKQSVLVTFLTGVVHRELCLRQPFVPIILRGADAMPEVIFKNATRPLRLTIFLRM
jgi:hypothetical protein